MLPFFSEWVHLGTLEHIDRRLEAGVIRPIRRAIEPPVCKLALRRFQVLFSFGQEDRGPIYHGLGQTSITPHPLEAPEAPRLLNESCSSRLDLWPILFTQLVPQFGRLLGSLTRGVLRAERVRRSIRTWCDVAGQRLDIPALHVRQHRGHAV